MVRDRGRTWGGGQPKEAFLLSGSRGRDEEFDDRPVLSINSFHAVLCVWFSGVYVSCLHSLRMRIRSQTVAFVV